MNFLNKVMVLALIFSIPFVSVESFWTKESHNNQRSNVVETKKKSDNIQPYIIVNPPGGGTVYSNKITILVPGIGGNASHFSNNGIEKAYHLTNWSLPYMLANQYGGDIFVYGKGIGNNFAFYRSVDWEGSNFDYLSGLPPVDISLITRSRHQQIVIFSPTYEMANARITPDEQGGPITLNESVYLSMLNSLTRSNPALKFSLIGHSRGGLLNMMIASNALYYRKIDNLFSLGTPYYFSGNALFVYMINLLGQQFPVLQPIIEYLDLEYVEAYSELMSYEDLPSIRQKWNVAIQDTYHHINAIAYGFSMIPGAETSVQGLTWEESGNVLNEALILAAYGISFDSDILVGTKSQFGLGYSDFFTSEGNLLFCDLFSGINDLDYLRGFERKLYFTGSSSMAYANSTPKKVADPNQPAVPHNIEPMMPLVQQNICQELM